MAPSNATRDGKQIIRRRSFMAQPTKHPTTGIYQLRRKVPEALKPALGREFKRSLKTRDARGAKARYPAAWAESEQAFALARAQLGGAEVLTAGDAQQLAARWFRKEQERLEKARAFTDMLAEEGAVSVESAYGRDEVPVYTTLRAGAEQDPEIDWRRHVVHPCIEAALRQHSLPVPAKDSIAYTRSIRGFRRTHRAAVAMGLAAA